MFKIKLKIFCKSGILRNQNGFTLVEVVVSIALLGIVSAGLFTGLGTTSKVLLKTDARETAKNLAETQMEFVKSQMFVPGASTYSLKAIPAEQSAYTASIQVYTGSDSLHFNPTRDDNVQKVRVTITGAGITYYLEDYKVR